MEHIAEYTLCFSFPFNKETSTMYRDNEEEKMEALQRAYNTVNLIVSSHGFISLESIMKYFELRPTRHCPGINFTSVDDVEIMYDENERSDIVTIYLGNNFRLRTTFHKKEVTHSKESKHRLHVVENDEESPKQEVKEGEVEQDGKG